MEIDPQAISIGARVVGSIAPATWKALASRTKHRRDSIKAKYLGAFEDHLNRTHDRIRQVKTLISKDSPLDLMETYVNLRLQHDESTVWDRALVPVAGNATRVFVVGTAGAGKTMLLKYLLLSGLQEPKGLVPLFLEFRSLRLDEHSSLEAAAFDKVSREGSKETYDVFVAGLEQGLFAIYLDGLDETAGATREVVIVRVVEFSRRFSKVPIIVSSRPGPSTNVFESFSVYHVLGLNLDQAVAVVEQSGANEELRDAFIEKLRGSLYKSNETFLSVPLLVTMMLLTFGSYSDVPDRMTVFYEQAFETLYALHDTTSKGPYKRPHFASLTPDVFRHVFETLSYITLSRSKFDFQYADLIGFIDKALKLNRVPAEPSLFHRDLEESVCLIQQDGIKYVFAHRSFQEYFAAKFALRYGGANQYDIINNCIGADWGNNTVSMMHEVDAIKLREKWVLPSLEKLESYVRDLNGPVDERLAVITRGLHISADGEIGALAHGINPSIFALGMSLARVTDLPDVFEIFADVRLHPEGFTDFEAYFASGQIPANLVGAETDETALVFEALYVEANAENRDWLEQTGLPEALDRYATAVSAELIKVRNEVETQKKLELEIL